MSARLARTAFVALLVVSLAMFLTPGDEVPRGGPDDKLVHGLIFVVLAVAGRGAAVPALPLGLGLAAYAGGTEILQATLPLHRDGDLRDWLADLVGVLLGLVLGWAAARVRSPAGRTG